MGDSLTCSGKEHGLSKEKLTEVLLNEGFRPDQDDESQKSDWLHFKREGKNYCLRCFENGQSAMMLMAPRIYDVTEIDNRLALLEAINHINENIFMGKVYIYRDSVHVTIEVRHLKISTVPALLNTYINDIDRCVREFASEYPRLEPENTDHTVH